MPPVASRETQERILVWFWRFIGVIAFSAALIIFGIALTVVGTAAWGVARGDVPSVTTIFESLSGAIDPLLPIIAITAAGAAIGLIMIRATFGGEAVEQTQDQIEDMADSASELSPDGGENGE